MTPTCWKILEETAAQLDSFRLQQVRSDLDEARLSQLRQQLSTADSLECMVLAIGSNPEGRQIMSRVVQEYCLQELLTLSTVEGDRPLLDWPNSLNKNLNKHRRSQSNKSDQKLLVQMVQKNCTNWIILCKYYLKQVL